MVSVAAIVGVIHAARIDLSDEKRAQSDIAAAFAAAGITARREVRLAPGDIIDFVIDGVGVEVKLRSSRKREIFRQLRRYAGHPEIRSLVLASNLAMGLPAEIDGKPLAVASLGRAWL